MIRSLSLALTLICAIIAGNGNGVFAQSTDNPSIDFSSMSVDVKTGSTSLFRLNFDISLYDYNIHFACIAGAFVEMPHQGECHRSESSSLKFTVRRPLPTVRRTWFGYGAEIEGSLVMSFDFAEESSGSTESFTVEMPVEYLEAKQTTESVHHFYTESFLSVGEGKQGRFLDE